MAKYGWSSSRGRARHLVFGDPAPTDLAFFAYCGAPIRLTNLDGFSVDKKKKLRALEVCDHCTNKRHKLRFHAR